MVPDGSEAWSYGAKREGSVTYLTMTFTGQGEVKNGLLTTIPSSPKEATTADYMPFSDNKGFIDLTFQVEENEVYKEFIRKEKLWTSSFNQRMHHAPWVTLRPTDDAESLGWLTLHSKWNPLGGLVVGGGNYKWQIAFKPGTISFLIEPFTGEKEEGFQRILQYDDEWGVEIARGQYSGVTLTVVPREVVVVSSTTILRGPYYTGGPTIKGYAYKADVFVNVEAPAPE
jgi:hypothetical protein